MLVLVLSEAVIVLGLDRANAHFRGAMEEAGAVGSPKEGDDSASVGRRKIGLKQDRIEHEHRAPR